MPVAIIPSSLFNRLWFSFLHLHLITFALRCISSPFDNHLNVDWCSSSSMINVLSPSSSCTSSLLHFSTGYISSQGYRPALSILVGDSICCSQTYSQHLTIVSPTNTSTDSLVNNTFSQYPQPTFNHSRTLHPTYQPPSIESRALVSWSTVGAEATPPAKLTSCYTPS